MMGFFAVAVKNLATGDRHHIASTTLVLVIVSSDGPHHRMSAAPFD